MTTKPTTVRVNIGAVRREANDVIQEVQSILFNGFIPEEEKVRLRVHLTGLMQGLQNPYRVQEALTDLQSLHREVQEIVRQGKQQHLENVRLQQETARKRRLKAEELLEVYGELVKKAGPLSFSQQLGIARGIFSLGSEVTMGMLPKLSASDLAKTKGFTLEIEAVENYARKIRQSLYGIRQQKPSSRHKSREGSEGGGAPKIQKGESTQKQRRR